MAEKNYLRYVPPGALRDLAQIGYQLLDNVVGFDDDYDTTGELLQRSLREDPVGTAKSIGSGVVESVKSAYDDPMGTLSAMGDEFVSSFELLSRPLPEDASREEMGRHLQAASVLSSVVPGGAGVKAGTAAAGRGYDNFLLREADKFFETVNAPPEIAPGSRMIIPSQEEFDVLPDEVKDAAFILPIRDRFDEAVTSRMVVPMGEEAREMIRPYGDAALSIRDVSPGDFPEGVVGSAKDNVVSLASDLDPAARASVLQHEISHFDSGPYGSDLPRQEVGTNTYRTKLYREENIETLGNVLDAALREGDVDLAKRALAELKEHRALDEFEMYEQNPGEMLARLAEGDPTMARGMSTFQALNPYINTPQSGSLNIPMRVLQAADTAITGKRRHLVPAPMDLDRARVFDMEYQGSRDLFSPGTPYDVVLPSEKLNDR